eukprot:m.432367 g.432367  ORF g.432367 m.432367 type:complete len:578 (-) comp56746_c0_seq30:114-1847(-)
MAQRRDSRPEGAHSLLMTEMHQMDEDGKDDPPAETALDQSESEADYDTNDEAQLLPRHLRSLHSTDSLPSVSEARRQRPLGGSISIPEDESDLSSDFTGKYPRFSFKKLWAFTGPGLLMSIAYIDPGNLESDLQAGAVGGYTLVWVLFWATVLGWFLQMQAVRLANATGMHMAQVCHDEFTEKVRIPLWLMVEIAIIASDIQEVIGSAIAFNILSQGKIPLYAGVLITGADTFTFLFLEQYGLRKLEAFFTMLIGTMVCTFGYMYYSGEISQADIAKGAVVPYVSKDTVLQAVGMVGAVIMPHNLYLHSALVLSRKIDHAQLRKVREANMYNGIESALALFVSFMVNTFVLGVFAGVFSRPFAGHPDMAENCVADEIDLRSAGDCLSAAFGSYILYIWAVGLLAAGQSSTMTGTYAGQFVMDGFLKLQIPLWKRVMITRSVAMIPAILVAVIAKGNDSTINTLDEWLNVLQSFQLPFALLPVMLFTSSETIMGPILKNSRLVKTVGWTAIIGILGINAYLIVSQLQELPSMWWIYVIVAILLTFYTLLVGRLGLGQFFDYFKVNRGEKYSSIQSESD